MKNYLQRAVTRINESGAIAAFGNGVFEQVRIFLTLLTRSNKAAFPVTFSFMHNKVPFTFTFMSHAELMLFHEIFCGHPYRLALKKEPEYIVDLGANIGVSTLYLHTCFPRARIAAVEANTALLSRLTDVVAGIKNVVILPYAAVREDGPVSFYINEVNSLGSSVVERASGTKKVVAQGRSLHSLLTEAGFPRLDVVKFDIEGAEQDVFEAYSERDNIQGFVGEVHEDLIQNNVQNFLKLWTSLETKTVPTNKEQRFNVYGTHA